MEVKGALNSAVLGIQRGMKGLDRNAADIASAKQMRGEDSPVEPLIDSKLNSLQVQASAKIVKAVDEAVGSLFDDKA